MLPAAVDTVMKSLCSSLEQVLSNQLEAVYLYGSIALGDYIEGSSDIDFLAILREPLTTQQITAIAQVHAQLEDDLPSTDIMGTYICREDLAKSPQAIPVPVTYYDKKLHTDGRGADLNPITWWILQNSGIRVYGADVPFVYKVTDQSLVEYVVNNMNSYWTGWIQRLEEQLRSSSDAEVTISIDDLDEAVEWCVLGMLRQYYSIRERGVISKTAAGRYGIACLPTEWHGLIREAIAIKRREPERVYLAPLQRLTDLVALLKWIHIESNRSLPCDS
jgi:hypothetical protein